MYVFRIFVLCTFVLVVNVFITGRNHGLNTASAVAVIDESKRVHAAACILRARVVASMDDDPVCLLRRDELHDLGVKRLRLGCEEAVHKPCRIESFPQPAVLLIEGRRRPPGLGVGECRGIEVEESSAGQLFVWVQMALDTHLHLLDERVDA